MNSLQKISNLATRASPRSNHFLFKSLLSTKPTKSDDEWNDAWEAAWLPDDLNGKSRSPWETDVNFPSSPVAEPDPETKAFVEDMNEKWQERRNAKLNRTAKRQTGIDEKDRSNLGEGGGSSSLYSLENIKKDYRVKKQRVHAGLWAKEIERMQEEEKGEAKFGESDIDRLLDSCSEIFDTANDDLDYSKIPSSSEFKNKPDGWETTSKAQDGNIWEMSQREEDILLQEFDRRIAYSKFQIASFIKSHIFSRRRPIDGWKYMIEVVGPNARKGKGNVARIPALSDAATQPFQEEKIPIDSSTKPLRGR